MGLEWFKAVPVQDFCSCLRAFDKSLRDSGQELRDPDKIARRLEVLKKDVREGRASVKSIAVEMMPWREEEARAEACGLNDAAGGKSGGCRNH